ncbi:MAG TPA: 16S rRNA (guanine(527)-N(7))-methyltransferase RsmG [Gammaproteobacteria bacterium]|nr:16S rRNA (guanine(527)-N(7))-methyltransferase RsmG [Gammaproteobacteria bacterium]
MAQTELSDRLASGLHALGLSLAPAVQVQLLDYVALLAKWNGAYNLTAVRDTVEMVTRHLLDSLAINAFLRGARVLDVGSGAGLPGIPLALANPDRQFVLLDSNGKKTRFMIQAVATLGLRNVEVVQSRAEDYRPPEPFATVVSRAFASLGDFLQLTAHLCSADGHWLAMKGDVPAQEIHQLPAGFRVEAVHTLDVPGLQAARCVVEIVKSA